MNATKTSYTAPAQEELLDIIKQLRDYIANSDIAPEDSDRLYQEHLALADSALSHPESDDEEEEEAIRCFQCEKVLKGEIAFPFDNNEGDKEEEDEDICYMCEACQWDPDYISSQEPEELEKHRAKMHTFERVAVN
jgi:actin-related protein